MANNRIKTAMLYSEVMHIKSDVRDIKKILTVGESKISDNRTQIASNKASIGAVWRVFGIIGGIFATGITILLALS